MMRGDIFGERTGLRRGLGEEVPITQCCGSTTQHHPWREPRDVVPVHTPCSEDGKEC